MASEDDAVKKSMIVDAQARNISHNVRWTEYGSQSIDHFSHEVTRKSTKKLEDDFGGLYSIRPSLKCKQQLRGPNCYCSYRSINKRLMSISWLDLVRGVSWTVFDILTPPPSQVDIKVILVWTTRKLQRQFLGTYKSTFGYVYLLARGAISRKSAKQSIIAISTMEDEFVAFVEVTIHVLWLRNCVSRLRIDNIVRPLRIYCKNSATIFFSKNDKYSKDAIHMDLKYLSVK
ncbi:hypothetical protein V8G54_012310 [Vigna mungo]|uniref:Retrovirus-related Pol polyprotein from transposon TNT 1-94 n=1 Tax=Vigna mungo TaxID=3915 RepID=A0AAQ3NRE3_VIGMU